MACHEDMEAVRVLLDTLDPDGFYVSEAAQLLGAPSAEETERYSTPSARRAAFLEMITKVRTHPTC